MVRSDAAKAMVAEAKTKLQVHLNVRENRNMVFPSEIASGPVS